MEMDKLKKKRKALRAAFARSVNSVEDVKEDEKWGVIDIIEKRAEEIRLLDEKIFELMIDADRSEEELQEELTCQEKYQQKLYSVKKGAEKSVRSELTVINTPYRLPKVELVKFGGEPRDWLNFWSLFQTVDKDSSIKLEDKFQYLYQSMIPGSRAYEVVKSFPPTAENYPKAVEELKARFGRDGLLVQVYVRELLSLVLKNEKITKLSVFYDKLECQLRALESLGVTSEKCAAILLPLVESCLPEELLRAWQRSGTSGTLQDDNKSEEECALERLRKFIKSEVENEERITLARCFNGSDSSKVTNFKAPRPTTSSLVNIKEVSHCIFCCGTHPSLKCRGARDMPLEDRRRLVMDKRLCFGCLGGGHVQAKCESTLRCFLCKGRHPAVLCGLASADKKGASETQDLSNFNFSPNVFLQTLVVKTKSDGKERPVRALIDTGSMRSYISSKLVQELGLKHLGEENLEHTLFGGSRTGVMTHRTFLIYLFYKAYSCRFKVLEQPRIASGVPKITRGPWLRELRGKGIFLSDMASENRDVDLLIGADVAGKLLTGKKLDLSCGLVAMETHLGWTIMGKMSDICSDSAMAGPSIDHASMAISMLCSGEEVKNLWELDVLGIEEPTRKQSKEELDRVALEHFRETVVINEEGRYEVKLPWVADHPPLPTNFSLANRRIHSVASRLNNNQCFEVYDQVLNEWFSEGIIEAVDEVVHDRGHYLPHRPVFKNNSTTKIRPVFDASAREKGQPSLNQCLASGINLIEIIPALLMRFRLKRIGVIADIKKAFLQISVSKEDRQFLKFLWFTKDNQIKIFQHARVVFGVSCSPFQLAAVINLHLERCIEASQQSDKPLSASVISMLSKSFYVDNCVCSVDSVQFLEEFIREATAIFASACFELRGWEYTDPSLLNCTSTPLLGLVWDRRCDTLAINTESFKNMDLTHASRRCILSVVHRVFDPVGFTCPVTLGPKLLLQESWSNKKGWDEEVDSDVKRIFFSWVEQLNLLSRIEIPRHFGDLSDPSRCSIHTFCDASQSAYASSVFLRVVYKNEVTVQLVWAKSRVAPIKKISIPRLELLAATIGSRLWNSVIQSSEIFVNMRAYFWSDSSTCLAWIKRNENWATFVRNRVEEIRKLTHGCEWRFVPGNLNPADLPSRGCTAKKLLQLRWWEGPSWLYLPEESWPEADQNLDEEEINKEKSKTVVTALADASSSSDWYYKYFSCYNRIVRMLAWINRFVKNCRKESIRGSLSSKELDLAEMQLIRFVQQESFNTGRLEQISALNPEIDDNGIIRLRTRIVRREDFHDFRRPILLPARHPVVARLVLYMHKSNCHVGVQGLLGLLREKYWILGGRKTIRSVVSKCVTCRRYSASRMEAPPAPLPPERVRDPVAFEVCGVDFAGPLYLKSSPDKAWICLFTCAVVRAVHLELVTSLSSEAFIMALRRFISRRGRPKIIFSDNGTNFTGTNNLLQSLDWDKIMNVQRIEWRFNPPSAPWWGGFFERMIRTLKELLRRVLGNACLGQEEITTILCDCESVINSRPLTYLSEDSADLTPICPKMFLQDLGDSRVPDLDKVENVGLSRKAAYRRKLKEELRARFRVEYLGQLQSYSNRKKTSCPEIGEVVLIGTDKVKRMDWPMARVTQIVKSQDGHVRLVRLKTANGEVLRPLQRLYRLEISCPELLPPAEPLVQALPPPPPTSPPPSDDEECDTAEDPYFNMKDPQTTRVGRVIKIPQRFKD